MTVVLGGYGRAKNNTVEKLSDATDELYLAFPVLLCYGAYSRATRAKD